MDQSDAHLEPTQKIEPEISSEFMKSLLLNLEGHEKFDDFRKWFRSLYCNPERPIYDVLGRLVKFDTYPTLDDCAHVCYGGTAGYAYNADHWEQKRAERIAWIGITLTRPTKIHPDENIPTNQKYLLYIPPVAAGADASYYLVIVRVIDSKSVAFLTAYPICPKQYDKFKMIPPRIYPPSAKPNKKRGRK